MNTESICSDYTMLNFKRCVSARQFTKITTSAQLFIYWDTCALLDILRIPLPEHKYTVENLLKYEKIYEYIKSNEAVSIASYVTKCELADNTRKTYLRLLKEESDLKKKIINFVRFSRNADSSDLIIDSVNKLNISGRCYSLFYNICKNTHILNESAKIRRIAHDRVVNHIAPAHQKTEYKDCYIWATYVDIMKRNSHNPIGIFFTTNTSDFKEKEQKEACIQLKKDISFSQNLHITFSIGEMIGKVEAYRHR